MAKADKLALLRQAITESLRVQKHGESIDYINVGTALDDARARQNHAIFARRGCGKTLLLHHSGRTLRSDLVAVYLNCEDFKRHSFPNVLIEILAALFREIERNLPGWFGKKKRSRQIVRQILEKLEQLQKSADSREENVRTSHAEETTSEASVSAGADIDVLSIKAGASELRSRKQQVERSFRIHRQKLEELDRWLPELKESIRDFFELSSSITGIFLQIDDLYHLKRTDQAFVVD